MRTEPPSRRDRDGWIARVLRYRSQIRNSSEHARPCTDSVSIAPFHRFGSPTRASGGVLTSHWRRHPARLRRLARPGTFWNSRLFPTVDLLASGTSAFGYGDAEAVVRHAGERVPRGRSLAVRDDFHDES